MVSDDKQEKYVARVTLNQFSMEIFANSTLMLTIAPKGLGLLIENTKYFHN